MGEGGLGWACLFLLFGRGFVLSFSVWARVCFVFCVWAVASPTPQQKNNTPPPEQQKNTRNAQTTKTHRQHKNEHFSHYANQVFFIFQRSVLDRVNALSIYVRQRPLCFIVRHRHFWVVIEVTFKPRGHGKLRIISACTCYCLSMLACRLLVSK